MNMRLVVILSTCEGGHEMTSAVKRFERDGYQIVRVRVPANADLDAMPKALSTVATRCGEASGRLVVISNRRDWVFAWARAYPERVDDYVWVPEPAREEGDDLTVAALASLAGLEADAARVHVALSWSHYLLAAAWLTRYPDFFRPMSRMDHAACRVKRQVSRELVLHSARVKVSAPRAAQGLAPEVWDALAPAITTEALLAHSWIWPYAIAYDAATFDGGSELALAVRGVLASIRADACAELFASIGEAEQQATLDGLGRGIATATDGGALSALVSALRGTDEAVCEAYPLLAGASAQVERGACPPSPDFSVERDRLVAQAARHLAGRTAQGLSPRRRADRIVFLLSQLGPRSEQPTRYLAPYVNGMRNLALGVEPALIVTDDLTVSPMELMLGGFDSAPASSLWSDEHAAIMPGVPIHYSRQRDTRAERVQRDLAALLALEPDAVVAVDAATSLLGPLVFPHFPVLFVSTAAGAGTGFCDVFAGPAEPGVLESRSGISGLSHPVSFARHFPGFDLGLGAKRRTRDQLALAPSDFVVCSAGRHLDAELTVDFVSMIEAFLVAHARARWLVVGGKELRLLRCRPGLWSRVRHVASSDELARVVSCADVFAEAFRQRSRHSVAVAMERGLPVISLQSSREGASALGLDAGVADARAYASALSRMVVDEPHRRAIGAAGQAHARSLLTWERAVRDLLALVDQARGAFAVRTRRRSNRSAA